MAGISGAFLAAAVYWLADLAVTSLIVILFVLALFIAGIVAWAARVAIVGKLVNEELDFAAVKIFGFLRLAIGASMFFLVLGFACSFPFGWGTITKFVSAFVLTAFGSLGLQSIAGFVINSILILRHVRSRRAA